MNTEILEKFAVAKRGWYRKTADKAIETVWKETLIEPARWIDSQRRRYHELLEEALTLPGAPKPPVTMSARWKRESKGATQQGLGLGSNVLGCTDTSTVGWIHDGIQVYLEPGASPITPDVPVSATALPALIFPRNKGPRTVISSSDVRKVKTMRDIMRSARASKTHAARLRLSGSLCERFRVSFSVPGSVDGEDLLDFEASGYHGLVGETVKVTIDPERLSLILEPECTLELHRDSSSSCFVSVRYTDGSMVLLCGINE